MIQRAYKWLRFVHIKNIVIAYQLYYQSCVVLSIFVSSDEKVVYSDINGLAPASE
jgi:hypothetical protein